MDTILFFIRFEFKKILIGLVLIMTILFFVSLSVSYPKNEKLFVVSSSLNVRSEPNPNSSILGKLKLNDSIVSLSNIESSWIEIELVNDSFGFVNSRFLSKKKNLKYVEVEVLNLRESPTIESDIISKLSKDDSVYIKSCTNNWFKVIANNKVGYVDSQFLTVDHSESLKAANHYSFILWWWKAVGIIIGIISIFWICFFIWANTNWRKVKKEYPHKEIDAFWLTSEEKLLFYKTYTNQIKAEASIDNINQAVKNEDIQRNQDGSISKRSNRGKKLSNDLEELTIFSKQNKKQLNILIQKPFNEWRNLGFDFKRIAATFVSFFAFISTIHYLISYFLGVSLLYPWQLFNEILFNSNNWLINSGLLLKVLFLAIPIGLLSSYILYEITSWLIGKILFKKFHKCPPLVTIDNYNSYTRELMQNDINSSSEIVTGRDNIE